jgi:mannose-6-phosphate isomerase-like protein (cupin superfamily)
MSEPQTQALESFVEPDTYREWQKAEGVRVIVDYAFEDLCEVDLSPWPRKGGAGAIINIPYPKLWSDSHLIELKPGGSSEPERHLYEEAVYILKGRGTTSVWTDNDRKVSFEWQEGSVFAMPLNAWYQHHNMSGTDTARYIAVTNAPFMMRIFRNLDFIFDNPFVFADRFQPDASYFSAEGKLYKSRVWKSNFLPDARFANLAGVDRRGVRSTNTQLEMASNVRKVHISEFPVGTYKKAHRHGPGANLFILDGEGFSLLWQEGAERRKCDWKRGGMIIVPTEACFHQHFNTGNRPARYLAFRGTSEIGTEAPSADDRRGERSLEEGGWQIEFEREDPSIHAMFEGELARHGAVCRMKDAVPWCTGISE